MQNKRIGAIKTLTTLSVKYPPTLRESYFKVLDINHNKET